MKPWKSPHLITALIQLLSPLLPIYHHIVLLPRCISRSSVCSQTPLCMKTAWISGLVAAQVTSTSMDEAQKDPTWLLWTSTTPYSHCSHCLGESGPFVPYTDLSVGVNYWHWIGGMPASGVGVCVNARAVSIGSSPVCLLHGPINWAKWRFLRTSSSPICQ